MYYFFRLNKVGIYPSQIKNFSIVNLSKKLSLEYYIRSIYFSKNGSFEIFTKNNSYLLSKTIIDTISPPIEYLEDYNFLNLDIEKIATEWENIGFNYDIYVDKVFSLSGDDERIKEFLFLCKSISILTDGHIIVDGDIPNYIGYGLYDLDSFIKIINNKLIL